jgi:2'-5' RNA ligase
MSDHKNACIVWPAWFEGSVDPELHVTALFLGSTEDATFTKEQLLDAIEPGEWQDPGVYRLMPGVDWFGRNKDIPVLRLYNLFQPDLVYTYEVIKAILWDQHGIMPASDFYPFQPHITLKNEKLAALKELPREVHLEAPVLWWGNDRPIHSKHRKDLAA